MNEIGARLQEAREKKGLTIEQVAKKIRVKEEYIENIEENSELVLDVFTVGYIKLYAKYLRVNITDELLEMKGVASEEVEGDQEEAAQEDNQEVDVESEHSQLKTNFIKSFFNQDNKKQLKFFVASALTIVLVIGGVFMLNQNSNKIDNQQVVEGDDIAFKWNQEGLAIQKTGNDEYLLKNIDSNANDIYILAKDSTDVTFLNDQNEVVQEIFVRIGEKQVVPKGYETLIVRTKVPLSIEFIKN